MSTRRRSDCAPADWNAVVHASPDAWVWALWEWQEIIGRVSRWQLEDVSFAVEEDNRLVAVVPMHWIASDRRLSGSGFGLTAPAIVDAPDGQRSRYGRIVFDEIAALAARLGARRAEIALSPVSRTALGNAWGVNPFVHYGWNDESGHARILDLTPDEAVLLDGLSKDARQQIRKTTAAGYTARVVDWREWLDAYYELHCETYKRTGVEPHDRRYFEGIAQMLAPIGHSVLTAGFNAAGKPVAFHNTARLGASAMYHTGCSSEEGLGSGVNYLVFWEALRHAKQSGCSVYELGEVFPGRASGKEQGLTTFKSKFGGEIRRSFRAAIEHSVAAAAPAPPATTEGGAEDRAVREAFGSSAVYHPATICRAVETRADDYAARLLQRRFEIVRRYLNGGHLLDVCCGTGAHLIHLSTQVQRATGIDFSKRYLETAVAAARDRGASATFVASDARALPLAAESVDLLYCFSSLYVIPRVGEALAEFGRVLRPGGCAIVDLGNRRSMNVFCLRYYPELASPHCPTLGELKRLIADAGLDIVEHHSFQLLPLWADRPSWLRPMLHPAWQRLMRRRVAGRMVDEWISSLPLMRSLAFRHLMVCRKKG